MTNPRIARLQELIHEKIATMLLRDLQDPRLQLTTISKVVLSPDVEFCKVYWSTLKEGGARSATEFALSSARAYIQREVARTLRTRKAPHLEFHYDPSVAGAARIQELIRKVRAEDDARHRPAADAAPPAGNAPEKTDA